MRQDATFIGVEIDDGAAADRAVVARLAEVCPVDVFTDAGGRVQLAESNIDECILCGMCFDCAPPGAVTVHRLYDAASWAA
jgi:NAD-dependent dihydropyrimidine dehydrogenase PreA subunit